MYHKTYVVTTDLSGLLATQGILDALCAGILIYVGAVNLLVPHFFSKLYKEASTLIKSLDLGSLWFGCIIMAIIGIWA
jgi:zinc transporter 1/2/3